MPTPEYHARWSPSAAHRLLNCPASMQLGEQFPKTTSQYAEAGRLAHAIAELKAQRAFLGLSTRSYNSQLKKLQASEHYDKDMDGYTQTYVETLEQQAMQFAAAPFTALETSVPIGIYTGEHKEDGVSFATGTADCIQIGGGTLWITDYKNGAGVPVSVKGNPQLGLYAAGALALYRPVYGDSITDVRMTIVQPALNSVSSWGCKANDILSWAEHDVKRSAAQAFSDDPGKPCPGDWCRFCPAKAVCHERACSLLAVGNYKREDPLTLTDDQIGQALKAGADLVSWYNDLKDYALAACLDGRIITGFKAVEGRSSREWVEDAFAALQTRGIEEALLYERKPVTVAGLEKTLGKRASRRSPQSWSRRRQANPLSSPRRISARRSHRPQWLSKNVKRRN